MLTGAVLLDDRSPATSAVVELRNAGGDIVDQTVVDDRGLFTFHVSAQNWSLAGWDFDGHRWRGSALVADDVRLELIRTS